MEMQIVPQSTAGPMPTAAEFQQLAELLQRFPGLFPQMDPRVRVTVAEVIDKYLANAHEEVGAETLEYKTRYLGMLRESLGTRAVGELTPFDLKKWISDVHRTKSDHTKSNVKTIVQRAFNWAAEMRLIRENPMKGLKLKGLEKKTGRDIKPDEFQAVLRHTDAYFRRFMIALKLTGARPGELAKLRWGDIDWQRGLATLGKHKTSKKTGKPRVIIFLPQVLKMLAIIRRDQHGPAAVELRRILTYAPNRTARSKEVVYRLQQLGFSYRAIYVARKKIGAIYRRVGGYGPDGHTVYELPANPIAQTTEFSDFVFVCSKQRPWNRHSLDHKFARLRKRIGLPDDCKIYGTRHFFCHWAVKRGVNMKAIACLLGHVDTKMVERVYSHLEGDHAFLQGAAKAATALTGTPSPFATPADAQAWQEILLDRYPRAKPKPAKRWKPRPAAGPLNDAERIAWKAYQFAKREDPTLGTDVNVFEWLIGRREFAGQLPPSAVTFRRYLNRARHHFEGAGKRRGRRLKFKAPEAGTPPAEIQPSLPT